MGHSLVTVVKRCGPGKMQCPIDQPCALAARKHYRCSSCDKVWLDVVKAKRHISAMQRTDVAEHVASKILTRCELKRVDKELRPVDGALPDMARRFTHGKNVALDQRLHSLTYGNLCHRLTEYHRALQSNDDPPITHIRNMLVPGWQVQFTRFDTKHFGLITAIPHQECVSILEICHNSMNTGCLLTQNLPLSEVESAGIFATYDFKSRTYKLLDVSQQLVAHTTQETRLISRIERGLRNLPSLPEAPHMQVDSTCPWPITRISALQAMAEHADHMIWTKSEMKRKRRLRCILDDPPCFWTPVSLVCKTCQYKEFWPKLEDIRQYF